MNTTHLTKHAKEWLEKGGCGGDICRTCNGTGMQSYPHDTDPSRYVYDTCYKCNGKGMRT